MTDPLQPVRNMIADEEHEELLTVQEYADRNRVHVQTVYSAIRYNRLPFQVRRSTGRGSIRIVVPRVPRGSIKTLNNVE